MNLRAKLILSVGALALTLPDALAASRVKSDVLPPQKRQSTVTNAERLSQRKPVPAVSTDLVSPFNPVDFDKPDPADVAASLAAAQRAAANNPGTPAATPPLVVVPGARETLEKLAAQIAPSGMFHFRGAPRIMIGNKPFEVGTRFTATYNNQDYELELIAIDRTTFTLRHRGEEITRPIKSVR